ncbi:VWA domain-containing protein [Jatrophihabitans sp. YIM 134969]
MTVSLEKRTESAQESLVSLLKKEQARGIDLGELTAQVEIAIDFSGSMRPRFKPAPDGGPSEVQTVVERALALSLSGLDDDGVVPVHFFHAGPFPPVLVDRDNHRGVVDAWAEGKKMGATNYAPPIQAILDGGAKKKRGLFGRKGVDLEAEKDAPPKLVLFVTDGAPADKSLTTKLVLESASRPVFWQFIGLGYKPDFMAKLDTMGNRVVDNVGLVEYSDTLAMTDTEFFDAVIGEFFTSWLPEARRLGITRR